MYPSLHCASFISRIDESDYFPTSWQATLVFFSAGLCLLMLTLIFSIAGWCVRSICRKSIFSIGGSVQALAGKIVLTRFKTVVNCSFIALVAVLLFTVGLVIYPAGWNSSRVRNICGEEADTFLLAECSLGWAFYGAAAGILLTCFSAVFSIQAEVSTSTDKIQDRILQGKKIICLPWSSLYFIPFSKFLRPYFLFVVLWFIYKYIDNSFSVYIPLLQFTFIRKSLPLLKNYHPLPY